MKLQWRLPARCADGQSGACYAAWTEGTLYGGAPVTILDPSQLRTYCGARGVSLDDYEQPRVVACTTCRSHWDYDAEFDWYRCPRGCGDRLDAYPFCATAGRQLNAHCPPPVLRAAPAAGDDVATGSVIAVAEPPANAADPPVEPKRRGRPAGSSSVTAEQIVASFAQLQRRLGHRPTRMEVAHSLHVSADTVDNVLKRAGMRFSGLR